MRDLYALWQLPRLPEQPCGASQSGRQLSSSRALDDLASNERRRRKAPYGHTGGMSRPGEMASDCSLPAADNLNQ